MKVVLFRSEETYIKKFISFPDLLYARKERTQNKRMEKALLQDRHCLNRDAEVWGVLVLAVNGEPLARCMISYYEGGEEAFFGFFECTENQEACHRLMETVKRHASQRGKTRVVGPVNVSFWLSYGLKTDHFETPYMGEPYNQAYYSKLLTAEGFDVAETLVSARYRAPETAGISETAAGEASSENASSENASSENASSKSASSKNVSSENASKTGNSGKYEVRSLRKREFRKALGDLYRLSPADCKTFSGGCAISEKCFTMLLAPRKHLFNFKAVKLAYRKEELVGFLAVLPDYGELLSDSTGLVKRMRVWLIRRKPKRYVLWYLGAGDTAPEVYETLLAALQPEILKRPRPIAGAPLVQGKAAEGCLSKYKESEYTYVLLCAPISEA